MSKSRSNKHRQPSRKEAREQKKLEERSEKEFRKGLKQLFRRDREMREAALRRDVQLHCDPTRKETK